MFSLKFNHVFTVLMILAGVTGFIIPSRFVTARVPAVEVLFAPVSRPSRFIAGHLHDSFAKPELSADQRSADVVKRENEALKSEISSLYMRIAELQKREESRAGVGDIRPFCTPFTVAGTDSGPRLSLGIQGSSLQSLKEGQFALYSGGIVGRVERAGLAGSRIRLITDSGFRVKCGFVRFDGTRYTRLSPPQSLAEGTGHGAMHIIGITHDERVANGLKLDDMVVVNDPDWPSYLQFRVLGRITAIRPRPDAPLGFDQLTVEPSQNLLRLTEVLVVTKAE